MNASSSSLAGSPVIFDLTAIPDEIVGITVLPSSYSMIASSYLNLSALGLDKFGNKMEAEVVWNSSDLLGDLDPITGMFIATTAGVGRIYAQNDSNGSTFMDFCDIVVSAGNESKLVHHTGGGQNLQVNTTATMQLEVLVVVEI